MRQYTSVESGQAHKSLVGGPVKMAPFQRTLCYHFENALASYRGISQGRANHEVQTVN